jgi:hypothetical protein
MQMNAIHEHVSKLACYEKKKYNERADASSYCHSYMRAKSTLLYPMNRNKNIEIFVGDIQMKMLNRVAKTVIKTVIIKINNIIENWNGVRQ